LKSNAPDFYAALGLNRRCTAAEIRDAWRALAKELHPDANGNSAESGARTREINDAYEVLGDPTRRRAYDEERKEARGARAGRIERNVSQDVHLRIAEFFRGAALEVRVNDPGNVGGPETYTLDVPAGTAPGARFRIPRDGGGFVNVRVKARPDARFKARGSDLRCDLRISAKLAERGGSEIVAGPAGNRLQVQIPAGAARGEIVSVSGEGLPKPRGGRGDLLVRVMYRPDVRVTRR
jgi:DnaJ-class molecular chaperone